MKWHKGPPPHVGWWNASHWRNEDVWRWWDGQQWSDDATPFYTPQEAAHCAKRPALSWHNASPIEWSDYWPAGARVLRVEP